MGDSNSEDVGFYYEWSTGHYDTTNWTYYVRKEHPLQFRLLGIVKRELNRKTIGATHCYVAFENAQHTNQMFDSMNEAKAWVVACTMGEKP